MSHERLCPPPHTPHRHVIRGASGTSPLVTAKTAVSAPCTWRQVAEVREACSRNSNSQTKELFFCLFISGAEVCVVQTGAGRCGIKSCITGAERNREITKPTFCAHSHASNCVAAISTYYCRALTCLGSSFLDAIAAVISLGVGFSLMFGAFFEMLETMLMCTRGMEETVKACKDCPKL